MSANNPQDLGNAPAAPGSRPISPVARRPDTHALLDAGCEHEEAGRLQEAIRCYRRVLRHDGRSAAGFFNLGNTLYQTGRRSEAIDCFRQVVQINVAWPEAWNNLGVVLCELQQCHEAEFALQKSLALAPWFADAFYNLADCYDERGQTDQATKYWQEYLQRDATSSWAQYARARLSG
ncbi:MAG TPA: tetratricopeptide repeat protein [Pirellulales bacterium]|jgi:tetratricopeptide (TPR) repeat protein